MGSSEVEALNPDQCFLLLDGALQDSLKIAYANDENPSVDLLYRGTRHQAALSVSPCLVKPSHHTHLWDNQNIWRANGVVVEAECELEILADHFRSLLSVRLPDQTVAYLRFYVPSQIQALLSVFTRQEVIAFSGPVINWHYFDRETGWMSLPGSAVPGARTSEKEGWFHLQQIHLDAMAEKSRGAFLERLAKALALPLTGEQQERTASIVAQAAEYGFRSEADIASYVDLVKQFESRMELPAVKAVMNDTGSSAKAKLSETEKILTQGGV